MGAYVTWFVVLVLWLAAGVVTVAVVATRRRMWREIGEACGTLLSVFIGVACFPAPIFGPKIDRWQFERRKRKREAERLARVAAYERHDVLPPERQSGG